MLQGLLALSTWTIFFTWIEQTGEHELTVSQNIRSIYFLAFVPIVGFGATTKTYVSQYYGNKDFDSIKIVQKRIQKEIDFRKKSSRKKREVRFQEIKNLSTDE